MSTFINPTKEEKVISLSLRGLDCSHIPQYRKTISIEMATQMTDDPLRPFVHYSTEQCTKCGSVIETRWQSAYRTYQEGADASLDNSLGGKWLLKYKKYKAGLRKAGLL